MRFVHGRPLVQAARDVTDKKFRYRGAVGIKLTLLFRILCIRGLPLRRDSKKSRERTAKRLAI